MVAAGLYGWKTHRGPSVEKRDSCDVQLALTEG